MILPDGRMTSQAVTSQSQIELGRKVAALRAKCPKLTRAAAVRQVLASDPDLRVAVESETARHSTRGGLA